ncbi:twin-arginine translocation signal domain-containing protein [Kribbella sancticallisti]|uniref:Twin-arginine translocation signal domain-containing protein n=1 Tax=Kribbella sancticallisti TaxID=460087 RepID=A0ABP4Q8G7_9ACTN
MTNLPPVSRRTLLRGTAGAGLGLAAGVPLAGTANAAPGGFPDYAYTRVAFTKANLRYNPTGELIFPSVRGTVGRISNALGRFYLYYAPHDAPGGLCLASSNSLGGPYTEYPNNPIIGRTWSPHYNVSHVSSPHALWNDDVNELWMYFHGENTTTRLARSTNGINFTYDKVVLSTSMLPAGTTETSYARVFRHDLPSRGARYVMVFMINTTANRRSIGWGWSPEGRNWTFSQTPLITPQEVGARDIGAPTVAKRNGSTYVIYHTNVEAGGSMRITEVGNNFDRRNHLGVFHRPLAGAPDNGRCAAPAFGSDGGVEYMIYEAGTRLQGSIAIARAV